MKTENQKIYTTAAVTQLDAARPTYSPWLILFAFACFLHGLAYMSSANASETTASSSNILSVAGYQTCTLNNEGQVKCWGVNPLTNNLPTSADRFIQFAPSTSHSCGIIPDGTLRCFGYNTNPPTGRFIRLSSGNLLTCGLRGDGSATCWGLDSIFGQPIALPLPSGRYIDVAAGYKHACAVTSKGIAVCIKPGNTFLDKGQANAPVGVSFAKISVGFFHSCGLKPDGAIQCWGSNDLHQLESPKGAFVQISAGAYNTCALGTDGKVSCWGDNRFHQSEAPDGIFLQVASALSHACAIRYDGYPLCWGTNYHGEITPQNLFKPMHRLLAAGANFGCERWISGTSCWGDNTTLQLNPPVLPYGLAQIQARERHTCGLSPDGGVPCWGDTFTREATTIVPGIPARQVSAGDDHNCILQANGQPYCWGDNSYGQVVASEQVYRQVSAGYGFTCLLRWDGLPFCAGRNDRSQTAVNNKITLRQITSGLYHGCGIKDDGTLYCWGNNTYGQLKVPAGTFRQVSAGYLHTCGIKDDNSLACWGWSREGELQVPTGAFTELTTGMLHNCAVRATDGTQVCWGLNDSGQAPQLTIKPDQLNNAVQGSAYSQTLTVLSPGYVPVGSSFSITSGALPSGLALSGAKITGTPTQTGSYTFTVQVVDANGFTATKAFNLVTTAKPLP